VTFTLAKLIDETKLIIKRIDSILREWTYKNKRTIKITAER
jgi:hypothetical protein